MADYRIYQNFKGFYAEKDRPLDAVYVGASNAYAFWQAPLGWERFGYTVYPFAVPDLPPSAIKYLIAEARKTQPDALYIVSLNSFKLMDITDRKIHYAVDFMPWSANKLALLDTLCDQGGYKGAERLEFYFPFIRFHSGWSGLTNESLFRRPEQLKSGMHYGPFLSHVMNVTEENPDAVTGTGVLSENAIAVLDDLLAYCRQEQIDVLFTIVPQSVTEETVTKELDQVAQLVQQAGFPILNMLDALDQIGLDLAGDFYNFEHTNIHGSSKYVDYFGAYLQEHYDFTDKRGDPAYSDWDEAAARYREIVDSYLLDFELAGEPRDAGLYKPLMLRAAAEGDTVDVRWLASPGAEGYVVYRQAIDSEGEPMDWERLDEVDGGSDSYRDRSAQAGTVYRYTVAPYLTENGQRAYGPFDSMGAWLAGSLGGDS